MARHDIDNAAFYVLDTKENVLHGEQGGPFPYNLKRVAAAAAARMNGRFGLRRYRVVTWLLLREAV